MDADVESSLKEDMSSVLHERRIEARGPKARKMKFAEFRSCEQSSSIFDAYISSANTCAPPEASEVCQITWPSTPGRLDLKKRLETAVLTLHNSNQVGHTKDSEEGGHLNQTRIIQNHITKYTAIPRSTSHYSKFAVKIKVPQRRASCLAPGTGVYYMPRQSLTSEGHGKVCTVEALSFLADVSCKLNRTHQRPSNLTPKLSENHAHKRSKKMSSILPKENSYKIVRKQRTPRRTTMTIFPCQTKLQKSVGISKCEEFCSCTGARRVSLVNTGRSRNRLPILTDASTRTTTNKGVLSGGKLFFNNKPMSNTEVPQAQCATNLERFPISSCQLSDTKKKSLKGLKRTERFTRQILHFIGEMTVPERLIREALGNNPDTSKALRLLVAQRKVTRIGPGGRGRAYEYVATEKGLLHLREDEQAVSEGIELTPESEIASSCNPVAGPTIVSDARNPDAQCLPTQVMKSPEVSAADENASSPYSVTPHLSFQWPVQSLSGITRSESLDLPSSGITEC